MRLHMIHLVIIEVKQFILLHLCFPGVGGDDWCFEWILTSKSICSLTMCEARIRSLWMRFSHGDQKEKAQQIVIYCQPTERFPDSRYSWSWSSHNYQVLVLPRHTVGAVPRWEPETVNMHNLGAWNSKQEGSSGGKLHHPLKTGGRGIERAVLSFRNA
jgi:hypothetical protein